MGKGDNRRPCQISREEYDRRWADAFGDTGPIRTIMSDDDRLRAKVEQEALAEDIRESQVKLSKRRLGL